MNIGLLGFGTVGRGAYESASRCNGALRVKRVLDIRVLPGYEDVMTTNMEDILSDPEIEAVVEVIGGLHPAYEFITAAMRAHKHVVTANKQLVSHYYGELHSLAREMGVQFRYTPSAGGGIPWLYNLRRAKRANEILSFRGIVNGTTNFILDSMEKQGADFAQVLAEAQRLGYAEASPSADIDGVDAQRKCVISANIAFDGVAPESQVPAAGIRNISREDIAFFRERGYVCKLLARGERLKDGNISAYVEPTLCPLSMLEAAVPGNYNLITLVGDTVGTLSFFGQGAGKDPTGSAVAQDLLDIAADIQAEAPSLNPLKVENSGAFHRYYVRKPGEAGQIIGPLSVAEMFKNYEEGMFFAGIME